MKIAIAQLNPTIGDLIGNAQKIFDAAEKAVEEGAQLLLTPELSLCGYPPRDHLLNPGFISKMSEQLETLAQQLPQQLTVLVGLATLNPHAEEKGEKPLHNSMALIEEGSIVTYFHKRLLPTYDVFDEVRYFEPGKQSNCFVIKEEQGKGILSPITIGVTICEDLWNDEKFWGKRNYAENPLEDLANNGADIIINLSASPYRVGKQKLREAMLRHSACHYGIPIVYANQVGANDDLIFDGTSIALNRQGKLVSRAHPFEDDLMIAEFSTRQQNLIPTAITPALENEEEEMWKALVLGVKDYARKCGFQQVVIGLSGGIDSSLVAAIARSAFGAENVLGVLMPSPYSSPGSISDAEALVKNLGIRNITLPIKSAMTAYDEILEPLFAGTEFGVAEENLQSRIRGNLLMAIANKFNYLLLSTGNKSEMAVGYCTLYGDMNGGLAVISDVPKTRVYALCRWLNQEQEIIPETIINKAPSAELKPDQQDQDSLPPYDILDEILHRFIHEHQSPNQIVRAGFSSETVQKVTQLVRRAEFKRRQAPPGLKVTDRAFGTGWRMPIASRIIHN
ncbi:NH(3)-dependent NAD(+) synthetase [Halothece sp. PCC 7418]|uniref:NAD+ synthase n=1 Tax=Halothece sp. (strain PCC 7418) TaxID=65093 RepID=UPI0002A05EC5|nr:NAD+ synthase [Halothece sp. PCC 7418]AFZ45653.1 NH(3)-dependent NAD(+) synthetase [Halothece sp. PCC 7418]